MSGQAGITVVVPVLDDRRGMQELLDALSTQTSPPDEVIIVEGGSTDGTRELLDSRRGRPLDYRILDGRGLSIAAARNRGVGAARCDWVACTDAGCRPVPAWLASIRELREVSDFVAGRVKVEGATMTEKVFALAQFPHAEELEDPPLWIRLSHAVFGRGAVRDRVGGGYMAFSVAAWRDVGGFPEGLRASDDRAFARLVARRGLRMSVAPDAVVVWRPRATWRGDARAFFNYARGDVRISGRGRHLIRLAAWASAPLLARRGWRSRLALLTGAGAYVALPLHRARREGLGARGLLLIPVAVAVKDVAQLLGAGRGLLDRLGRSRQPHS